MPVLDGLVPEELALGVGASKSSLVTLKQGTLIEKSIVSTKVFGGVSGHGQNGSPISKASCSDT